MSERFGLRLPPEFPPPAEMKLQGSILGRMGDGRGRGMTLTSRRRVLGLQRAGLGWREKGTDGLSSGSCVSWHKGRSKTGKKKTEKTKTLKLTSECLRYISNSQVSVRY